MDLHLLHIYMELTAAACLFFIAWLNIRYNASGIYSPLMAIGTSIAAVTDMTHALVPVFFPNIAEHWMMMSWGASRITLVLMFMMVFLCYDVIKCRINNLAVIMSIPLLFTFFMAMSEILGVGGFHWGEHGIVIFGNVVNCPFDFLLLGMWLATAILLRHKSKLLFPPHVYWLFMSQGIMVHAIMSFSAVSTLDVPSFMAHALKISEYYSFILIYLLYKSTHDLVPNKTNESDVKPINSTDDDKTPAKLELTKGNR